ncbi:hypothetical protein K435DRAFT_870916 [Dendrothele bispora CBS 962.96]|uniref:Uncharacterized protein n=1 Tax=Dendrothele bispora (strain CBS 962.96) TaxID=1314807 RepID=A0A4S8L6S0_DENBC|nr:hypothetical protein K435DRAFT_870916 [Dendrothele bispora CBS 962.96]
MRNYTFPNEETDDSVPQKFTATGSDARCRHALHKVLADTYIEARKLWDHNRAVCIANGGTPDDSELYGPNESQREIERFLEFTGLIPTRPVYVEELNLLDYDNNAPGLDSAIRPSGPTRQDQKWRRFLSLPSDAGATLRRRSSTLSHTITRAMSQPFLQFVPKRKRRKCVSMPDLPNIVEEVPSTGTSVPASNFSFAPTRMKKARRNTVSSTMTTETMSSVNSTSSTASRASSYEGPWISRNEDLYSTRPEYKESRKPVYVPKGQLPPFSFTPRTSSSSASPPSNPASPPVVATRKIKRRLTEPGQRSPVKSFPSPSKPEITLPVSTSSTPTGTLKRLSSLEILPSNIPFNVTVRSSPVPDWLPSYPPPPTPSSFRPNFLLLLSPAEPLPKPEPRTYQKLLVGAILLMPIISLLLFLGFLHLYADYFFPFIIPVMVLVKIEALFFGNCERN